MNSYRNRLFPFLSLMAGTLICSCTSEVTEGQTSQKDTTTTSADTAQSATDSTLLSFPMELTNETMDQVYDETRNQPLTNEQIQELSLEMIESAEGGCTFYNLGKFAFSENFDTWLILWTSSWSQWMMWLVTYSPENKLLEYTLVLAGDSVEYYSETFSTITREQIEVTTITYDYSGEEEKSETEKVQLYLDDNGFFHVK